MCLIDFNVTIGDFTIECSCFDHFDNHCLRFEAHQMANIEKSPQSHLHTNNN